MTALNLTKSRFGTTLDGYEIAYFSNNSMALPAEIVEYRNGFEERTRYDSRFYALAVFAQEIGNQDLLELVQENEPCDCGECGECEEEN